MASQSASELGDSGIYSSIDNFPQSQVYDMCSSGVECGWLRYLVKISRRVTNGLEWDISRLEKHLRELKLELDFFTSLNVILMESDKWAQDASGNMYFRPSSEQMTHEFDRRVAPVIDSNPVPQMNKRTIGNASNKDIGPVGTIGSCERPSQPPPLDRDPNVWQMKTSVSCGVADSDPVNRHYSSFHPNSNSSELNYTANNGNVSVQSIPISNIDSVASEETYTCTCTRCVADSHTNNFRDSQTQTEPVSFSLPVYTNSQDACIQCDLLTVDFSPENKVVSPENEVNSVHEHRDTRDRVTSCERGRSEKRTSKSSHCGNISVSRSSSSGRSDSRDRRSRSKYRSSEHSGLHSYARANGHREEQSEKQGHSSQGRTSSCSSDVDSFSSTYRGETSRVTSGRRCFSCDSPEHFIRDCPDKKTRTCFKCGSSNHLIKFCPKYKQQKVRFKS